MRDPLLLEMSVPGSLAAGDCRHRVTGRIATAVDEEALAASFVHRYQETV
ncbi:MAG: hypothetical protein PVI01_14105 [Gemmatimonadales bacterium]